MGREMLRKERREIREMLPDFKSVVKSSNSGVVSSSNFHHCSLSLFYSNRSHMVVVSSRFQSNRWFFQFPCPLFSGASWSLHFLRFVCGNDSLVESRLEVVFHFQPPINWGWFFFIFSHRQHGRFSHLRSLPKISFKVTFVTCKLSSVESIGPISVHLLRVMWVSEQESWIIAD